MTSTPTVVLSVLLAAGAAAAVSLALRPAASVAPTSAADVATELVSLREAHAALQREVERLRTAPVAAAPAAAGGDRVAASPDPQQLAAAVEAYLQRRSEARPAAAAADAAAFDLERDVGKLHGSNYWNDPTLWKRAFEAGRMDEVVGHFEALAKANPKDVDAQMDLARAYMAYQQLDPSKWQNSMKADQVFDTVLALDENHWEARFTKAVSYTFWPEFLGKKKDAITHFETLVRQQELQPVQAHQAQTYLYLGNLLEQSDPKRAAEIWAQGLRRHPQDAALMQKAK
ncbi:MAG: tetratricopeptide repeat protein [Planctomycetes bacterium]|nr:tetratricopeptide repeat protein [Planctomycetota bacterium]